MVSALDFSFEPDNTDDSGMKLPVKKSRTRTVKTSSKGCEL
jgi:hypothetical protein